MNDNLSNFIGKKAVDVLKELETKNVKVGTKSGSGFIYCGELGMLGDDKQIDRILLENLKRRAETGRERFRAFVRNYPTAEKYITLQVDNGKSFSYDGFIEYEKEYFRRAQVKMQNVEAIGRLLADRTPFQERIVTDAYMSIDEEDCAIIIFEGVEVGDYWMVNEYKEQNEDGEVE